MESPGSEGRGEKEEESHRSDSQCSCHNWKSKRGWGGGGSKMVPREGTKSGNNRDAKVYLSSHVFTQISLTLPFLLYLSSHFSSALTNMQQHTRQRLTPNTYMVSSAGKLREYLVFAQHHALSADLLNASQLLLPNYFFHSDHKYAWPVLSRARSLFQLDRALLFCLSLSRNSFPSFAHLPAPHNPNHKRLETPHPPATPSQWSASRLISLTPAAPSCR